MPGCRVCGPVLEGCHRCGAKFGHAHITITGRDGNPARSVVVCGAHTPAAIAPQPEHTENAGPATRGSPSPTITAKRTRDRERRAAQRRVLDRHADEVQDELDRIRKDAP